jgi:RNA polymerase sigma factor (sigma-70 family)
VRIRDAADGEAWQQFAALYAPLVYRLARKRGLQDADATDVTQEVFHKVSITIKSLDYDPRRGSFGDWLALWAGQQFSQVSRNSGSGSYRPGLSLLLACGL